VRVVGVGVVSFARDELLSRKVGQQRYAERRAASWEALRHTVVLESTVGSRAWGLAEEGSDTDVRGIFALPFDWREGLDAPPTDLVSTDASTTFWEVRKAIDQALRADPNTLEALFVPSVVPKDEIGQWILESREAFVSAEIYGSFGRYAISQLNKLSQSLQLAEHRTIVLGWLREDPDLTLDVTAKKLADAVSAPGGIHQAKQYIKQLYRSLYDQGLIADREFVALKAFATQPLNAFQDLPRELRPKNAYNLLRLLRTAIDWLETGEPHLTVEGAFRDRLLQVKHGEVPLDEVLAEAEAMTPALEAARQNPKVPAEPDRPRVDALLLRIAETIARRHLERATRSPAQATGRTVTTLTDAQWEVTLKVIAEEETLREHLVIAVSGAHAYGFPSPDSDVDLKAVHIAPSADLMGLSTKPGGRERMEIIDGVEIDFSSNEIQAVLAGVTSGNGNFIERLLGARLAAVHPALSDLVPLIRGALSKKVYRHYHGFANSQLREMDKAARAPAKKVLYVLRTALTGAHMLSTGEVVADLSLLLARYKMEDARSLIDAKRAGEKTALSEEDTLKWRARVGLAFQALDEAFASSPLPDESPNVAELDAWLIALRRRR